MKILRNLSLWGTMALACMAHAQTKADLGSQVKGQLPPANALNVIQTARQSATQGTIRPVAGPNGEAASFFTDIHGPTVNGACQAPGWEVVTGLICSQGGFYPAAVGTAGNASRTLVYGGGFNPQGYRFSLLGRAYFAGGGLANDTSLGWNANSASAPFADVSGAKDIKATVTPAGLGMNIGGNQTVFWNVGGNNTGQQGVTDSGSGNSLCPNSLCGWAPPVPGMLDLGFFVLNATDTMLSVMLPGTITGSASFRHHSTDHPFCASPCTPVNMKANLQNFVVHASANFDLPNNISAAEDFFPNYGGQSLLIPHAPGHTGVAALLRWAIHKDGTECLYDGSEAANACQDVFAYIPPSYNPDAANRWVMHFHGVNETPMVVLQGSMDQVGPDGGRLMDQLFQNGYVIVAAEGSYGANGRNHYGSPQAVQDTANVVALIHRYLAVSGQPFLTGDSQGCENMLNSVAHGVVTPAAMAGYSCNTSLSWAAYNANAGGGPQMPYIAADYGFSDPAQYPVATAGYDPLLTLQGNDRFVDKSTEALMQGRLLSVPTLMSYDATGDLIAVQQFNSAAYASTANAANHSTVTEFIAGGGHVNAAQLNGTQVLNFFNAH